MTKVYIPRCPNCGKQPETIITIQKTETRYREHVAYYCPCITPICYFSIKELPYDWWVLLVEWEDNEKQNTEGN